MLYKNLPNEELVPVMRMRGWLDGIAAFKFLLTGDIANFKAVVKARREYRRMRPGFESDRRRNMDLAVDGGRDIPQRYSGSLLLHYYLMNGKKFSCLHF